MKRVIERQCITDAIRKEPLLIPGGYCDSVGHTSNYEKRMKDGCQVCAVGAVIKWCLEPLADALIEDVGSLGLALCHQRGVADEDFDDELQIALDGKLYFRALSMYFEERLYKKGFQPVDTAFREELCCFVDKHFPETLEVEIPARFESLFPAAVANG
jgi:hypothetical protein